MTIKASVIADSVSKFGVRLTTLQLRFPRFILAQLNTHRQFSRNASSSRAIPVERLIQDVIDDPVMPLHWGANKPGMRADSECDNIVIVQDYDRTDLELSRELAWLEAMRQALVMAKAFDAAGYHKQIVNRIIEPFAHTNVVVSSTAWSNFFSLRIHDDAQPEIKALAEAMKSEIDRSIPKELTSDEWHLPYIDDVAKFPDIETAIRCSVARCARVSYMTHDNKVPSVDVDEKLYFRLLGSQPVHASPAEHVAKPDDRNFNGTWQNPHLHGNYIGWIQWRKTLPNECM